MAIKKSPLDKRGITPSGARWRLMPIVEQDLDTVYWTLLDCTGANKSETNPK